MRKKILKGLLNITIFLIIMFFIQFLFTKNIYLNDYLNPYTLTFKNPKTIQMFNIIVLYHYVMTFLVGVIIFTFIFIFLSIFRTYFFFNYKTFFIPRKFADLNEFKNVLRRNINNKDFINFYRNISDYTRSWLIERKKKNLEFYKNDIKTALVDQITHSPILEFFWVIFPALILVAIAYPSIILLYHNEAYVEPVFNITVVGNQWFWTYEYNDFNLLKLFKNHITSSGTVSWKIDTWVFSRFWNESHHNYVFAEINKKQHEKNLEIIQSIPRRVVVDCNMIIAKDPKFLRLLSTDQCLVIPAKTPLRFLITSADVIHSWAIPSYGVKLDAVPGRINQQLLTVPLMGTSWGQCSELCGVNHAFMPIEIKVLAFPDLLFFMQLRVKEILMPYLIQYYENKLRFFKTIKTFLKFHEDFLEKNPSKRLKTPTYKLPTFEFGDTNKTKNSKRIVKIPV